MLARAGVEVDLGARVAEAVEAPAGVRLLRAAELELSRHDLVVFAVPAHALPAAVAEHGAAIPARAGVLVRSAGLVPPLGTLPTAYVAEHTLAAGVASLGGPATAAEALAGAAPLVVGAANRGLGRQLRDALAAAGFAVVLSSDVRAGERAVVAAPSVPVPAGPGARAA
jgi:glycerol-3-phosphate dehydrogenase